MRQIVWRADEAEEIVDRLNALGSGRTPPMWSWAAVWVSPREANAPVELTPDDREKLARAGDRGVVSVFFTFTFNGRGAARTCNELRALGWSDVGIEEEVSGDECFHVYAHGRPLTIDERSITALREQMEHIAELNGGVFDEWDLSRSASSA